LAPAACLSSRRCCSQGAAGQGVWVCLPGWLLWWHALQVCRPDALQIIRRVGLDVFMCMTASVHPPAASLLSSLLCFAALVQMQCMLVALLCCVHDTSVVGLVHSHVCSVQMRRTAVSILAASHQDRSPVALVVRWLDFVSCLQCPAQLCGWQVLPACVHLLLQVATLAGCSLLGSHAC
jgi:hypothetical protein